MNPSAWQNRARFGAILGGLLFLAAISEGRAQSLVEVRIAEAEGVVEVSPKGATDWVRTGTNQLLHASDRIRTGANSRATLLWTDKSAVPMGPLTELEILPPPANEEPGLHLLSGIVSFFHRDKPARTRILYPGANAGIVGTEFVLETDVSGRSILSVIDGRVDITNAWGTASVTNDEQAFVLPGSAPQLKRGFIANNILQWCFYYPAVLYPGDLDLTPAEASDLAPSLAAYRSGDVLRALELLPSGAPSSDNLRIYRAALLLAVGQAGEAETNLDALSSRDAAGRPRRLGNALRLLIAAVKRDTVAQQITPELPTELLAASYYEQSRGPKGGALEKALTLARKSAELAPDFGFASEREAELQFSFGRTSEARDALRRSLAQSPRNAEAVALEGFLASARNRMGEAQASFNYAIALDPGLGNAWLGRGLSRIRVGRNDEGREDLLVAAALEPQRSLLRSYLGKAFSDAGDDEHAAKELVRALALDPNDPTGWLYSALLKQQENLINPAISDLQEAQEKNDNRGVFRSGLLLDQDRAVESANLASVYRDAGMTDLSVREAARAVTEDYANHSAHLFLSDSYYALLDPTQFNLRYDTAQFNEYLLANILAPVGAGRLSQQVSQQDYSKLFESDGLGLAGFSDERSDGVYHDTISQFGLYGNTAYALDLDYHHDNGVRVNNDLDFAFLNASVKQQVTPQDTAMLLLQYENYNSGDNFQYYDQGNAMPNYRFNELQQPILVGTWRHEWAPGMQTLLLVDRLVDQQHFSDIAAPQTLYWQGGGGGPPYLASSVPFDVGYDENFEIYGAELQQIAQWDRVTLLAGGRYQAGHFNTSDAFYNPGTLGALFQPSYTGNTTDPFRRLTAYSYLTVEPLDHLWVTGGVAADSEKFPYYFRNPPILPGTDERSQIGPKAAVVWSPLEEATIRGIYTRSLGGVSLDETYRLEPTELAGFPQAFRSLISESVAGSQSAPTFETLGGALDIKLPSRTYIGIQLEHLGSKVNQGTGDFLLANGGIPAVVSSTSEFLDYKELAGTFTVNQLAGDDFVLGADYKITRSHLHETLPQIPSGLAVPNDQTLEATLQEVDSYILFNHPSGFYARAEAHWYGQHNTGWTPAEPDVSFLQENVFAGYRLAHRRIEVQVGVLNLGGGNYSLNPLTVYQELPRKRVFEAGFNFIF